jgi:iron complex outermembrane recepter protein
MKLNRLFQSLVLTGAMVVAIATSARTEEVKKDVESKNFTQLSEIKFRVSRDRIIGQTLNNPPPEAQKQDGVIPITGVEITPTESGVEVILQTPLGQQLQISDRSEGNNFIAEIEGAQLQLPDSKPFRSQKPVAGISEIVITNLDDKTIQVTVVGETALPQVELFDSDARLIFGLTPSASSAQTPPSSLPPLQGRAVS